MFIKISIMIAHLTFILAFFEFPLKCVLVYFTESSLNFPYNNEKHYFIFCQENKKNLAFSTP